MTEEEAEMKWCPMSRVGYALHADESYGYSYNRGATGDDEIDTRCLASACMMWRREKDTSGDDYGKDIPDNLGYCGLGGKP